MNPKTADKRSLRQRNSEAPGSTRGPRAWGALTSLAPHRHGGASRALGLGRQRCQAAWEAAGGPGSGVLSAWVASTASQSLQCGICVPSLDHLPEHGPTSSQVHVFVA